MRFLYIMILSFGFSPVASAMESQQSWGLEAGFLSLHQSSGGNTTTVLPLLNWHFLKYDQYDLGLQFGGTVYKDAGTGKSFGISALRLTPSYRFSESSLGLEALLGAELWEAREGLKTDLGVRLNYRLSEPWLSVLNELFIGGGQIFHADPVSYLTVGAKAWF